MTLDGEAVETLFGDADVEAHGLKGAIAIAVTSAAILAPAGQAAVPQSSTPAHAAGQAQATAQVGAAATAQVSSLVTRRRSRSDEGQVSKQ